MQMHGQHRQGGYKGNMKQYRFAACAAVAALMAAPQAARADDFESCDGFAAPTKKTDGMTEGTWMFGLATATVDLRAADIRLGDRGITACDKALADPLLLADHWLRRAHLQQAKALHAIQAGKPELALEAADQSDETGKSDPFFAVSLGLGNQALRALALGRLDRKQDALDALEKVSAARPWSASIQRLTNMLQFRIDAPTADASFRNSVPLAPENARLLYWDAFLRADYSEAIAYAPIITWDLPKKRGGWTMEGEAERQLENIEDRAQVTGALAFAMRMEGRTEEAALVVQEAADDLAEAMALPPQRAGGKPPKKRDVEAWEKRQPYAEAGKRKLDLWQQAAEFVAGIPARHPDEAFANFASGPFSDLPIFPAVMGRLNLTTPEQIGAREEAIKQYQEQLAKEKREAMALTTRQIADLLPRRLTAKMMPVMKPAGDGYFLSDTGLSRAQEGTSDIWTIRFVHKTAPIHVVEELAMYGAAMTAQREGKDSLVVLSRRSAELSTTIVGYYSSGSTFASGYEAQLRVRLVNANALPSELAGMEYRVIPASAIIDDMSKRVRGGSGITIAW
jgi:tetratricopeptide (TPR) repeat protein